MLTATIATLALFAPQGEKWEIKPTLTREAKTIYSVIADVTIDGGPHTAKFTMTSTVGDKDSDGNYGLKIAWDKITVDDGEQPDLPTWELKMDKSGTIQATAGNLTDDYRRMLAPLAFSYPDKAVAVGDKWEAKSGKAEQMTFSYEAKSVEKVKDVDALKISCKFKEGDKGSRGEQTWWVAKDGKILKFDVNMKDWMMAFSDNGPMNLDASFKGSLP